MKQLEVYFDYLCPYCYKGHANLKDLLKEFSDISVIWRPCEAHPRPEVCKVYTDVANMGMFFVRDQGGDVLRYIEAVYEAGLGKGKRIDDPNVLAPIAEECGVDPVAFCAALKDGRYQKEALDANRLAWEEKGWEAVPSYSSGTKKIGSKGGVLVPKEELRSFLKSL